MDKVARTLNIRLAAHQYGPDLAVFRAYTYAEDRPNRMEKVQDWLRQARVKSPEGSCSWKVEDLERIVATFPSGTDKRLYSDARAECKRITDEPLSFTIEYRIHAAEPNTNPWLHYLTATDNSYTHNRFFEMPDNYDGRILCEGEILRIKTPRSARINLRDFNRAVRQRLEAREAAQAA